MCFPLATDIQSLPDVRRTAQESKEVGDIYMNEFPWLANIYVLHGLVECDLTMELSAFG